MMLIDVHNRLKCRRAVDIGLVRHQHTRQTWVQSRVKYAKNLDVGQGGQNVAAIFLVQSKKSTCTEDSADTHHAQILIFGQTFVFIHCENFGCNDDLSHQGLYISLPGFKMVQLTCFNPERVGLDQHKRHHSNIHWNNYLGINNTSSIQLQKNKVCVQNNAIIYSYSYSLLCICICIQICICICILIWICTLC